MLMNVVELAGLVLGVIGFGLAWLPLGFIAAACALLWLARERASAEAGA